TIQPDTVFVNSDGSIDYGPATSGGGSGYTVYQLPSKALGEVSTQQPKCDATDACVIFVGEDQTNFSLPNTFSAPFYMSGSTKTTITSVSPTTPVSGQPIAVAVQVDAQYQVTGYATPTGTVTVSDGTKSCNATLAGSNGVATGTCNITETTPKAYSLTAKYLGSSAFLTSTSAASPVTVSKASSTTTLKLSASSIVLGSENTEKFTVTVKPQFTGTPSGSVKVEEGTKLLCTAKLSKGAGSCSLTASELPKGSYSVKAVYAGNTSFKGSTSATSALTVT
ncbi:MAG TPA: Ig-like domain-containing protein, partial [Acidimicrobiales bacterium]|nr:Ig-like domain-containing protein [Acidimicrobiales bacterium]